MQTPARILRAEADDLALAMPAPGRTMAQQQERIVDIARPLLARHGRHAITFASLAVALRLSTRTLRRHFADLDALLAEILRRHLRALSQTLGDIPFDAPNRDASRRAAYLEQTRTQGGDLTESHLLLTRDTHLLPDDERLTIEHTHHGLGAILAGPCGREALLLLDSPVFTKAQIEAMLAPLARPQPQGRPQPPPQQKPQPHAAPAQRPLHTPPQGEGATRSGLLASAAIQEKPGGWVFNAGIPLTARAPP